MSTKVSAHVTWRFVGKSRRHEVELRHNTISGKQLLTVNGEVLHRVNWKYKLTGNMYWELDGSVCELYIRADGEGDWMRPRERPGSPALPPYPAPPAEDGNIHYTLTVDNKEVALTGDRVSSTWVVALADGLHQVEFEHRSYDILVDGLKVEAGEPSRTMLQGRRAVCAYTASLYSQSATLWTAARRTRSRSGRRARAACRRRSRSSRRLTGARRCARA